MTYRSIPRATAPRTHAERILEADRLVKAYQELRIHADRLDLELEVDRIDASIGEWTREGQHQRDEAELAGHADIADGDEVHLRRIATAPLRRR